MTRLSSGARKVVTRRSRICFVHVALGALLPKAGYYTLLVPSSDE